MPASSLSQLLSIESFSQSSQNARNYSLFLYFFHIWQFDSTGNSVGFTDIKICPESDPSSPSQLFSLWSKLPSSLTWITNTFQQVSLFLPLSLTPSLVPVHQSGLSFHNVRQIILLLCSKLSYSIQRKSKVFKMTCKAVHDLHPSASLLNVTALQPH